MVFSVPVCYMSVILPNAPVVGWVRGTDSAIGALVDTHENPIEIERVGRDRSVLTASGTVPC